MSLSDRERRVLEQLERDLYASDNKFVKKVDAPKSIRALVGGSSLGIIGISVIVFAVIVQVFWFGLLGFIVLFTGLVLASSNWMDKPTTGPAQQSAKPKRNFFEERWDKRQGQ